MSKPPPPKCMRSRKIVSLFPQRGAADEVSVERTYDEEGLDFPARQVLEANRAIELLTPRQLQVLRGVVRGDSSKQIAHDLGINVRTVEVHRRSLMLRLNARRTADAVRIGIYASVGRIV